MATLYYVHDPMCSWCWGYQPVWNKLREQLPEAIEVINVLGGLARDSDQPMPEEMQQTIQGHWQRIQQLSGADFNFQFWAVNIPRRSTYPACRAVIAAASQGAEERMMAAIQEGYYQRAMNPSDIPVLAQFAKELGLDDKRFVDDMASPETEQAFQAQLQLRRTLPIDGFPSLVLESPKGLFPVELDYQNEQTSLKDILDRL